MSRVGWQRGWQENYDIMSEWVAEGVAGELRYHVQSGVGVRRWARARARTAVDGGLRVVVGLDVVAERHEAQQHLAPVDTCHGRYHRPLFLRYVYHW